MIRISEEISINRKLTDITKGINNGAIDRIEVPTHDWFYSIRMRELYHYEAGSFEAYPQKGENKFYTHHFLKVLPASARQVLVGNGGEGYWRVEYTLEWLTPHSKHRFSVHLQYGKKGGHLLGNATPLCFHGFCCLTCQLVTSGWGSTLAMEGAC